MTGSAGGPLGCYLVRHGLAPAGERVPIVCEQGYEIGRPSLLHLRASAIDRPAQPNTEPIAVEVGGLDVGVQLLDGDDVVGERHGHVDRLVDDLASLATCLVQNLLLLLLSFFQCTAAFVSRSETIRDLLLAFRRRTELLFPVIFLLVVGQFRSYLLPLIIMAPIPLTIIGVMPGHALFGANFTATSMIGMIALAGIIVRNSILLVDFIMEEQRAGKSLEDAVVRAASVRAKPIVLTAIAAMMGGFFILDDPIFNGLAISLIFGILISTLLTLVVIPMLYYSFRRVLSPNVG